MVYIGSLFSATDFSSLKRLHKIGHSVERYYSRSEQTAEQTGAGNPPVEILPSVFRTFFIFAG